METTEQKQKILSATLDRLKEKAHLPQDLVYLLGETAKLQIEAGKGISMEPPHMDMGDMKDRVAKGGSCLAAGDLPLDMEQVTVFFSEITALIKSRTESMPAGLINAAEQVEAAVESGELDLGAAVRECLGGEGGLIADWAERTPDAPASLRFLVLASVAPSLGVAAGRLSALLTDGESEGGVRPTGTCPVCGSLPHILELREKEGVRFAACSVCRHEYRIRRLACPVCDTTDADKMKYFTAKGEPGFRVETCDACKTYVKTIDFRELDRVSFPALNDLESLALDLLAADQGYARPAPSVWGI